MFLCNRNFLVLPKCSGMGSQLCDELEFSAFVLFQGGKNSSLKILNFLHGGESVPWLIL